MRELEHHIGGKSVAGTSGRHGPVFDPARGVQTARVPLASAAEVAGAVDIAREAAAEASGTRAVCTPRAGSKTGPYRPEVPAMDLPPM